MNIGASKTARVNDANVLERVRKRDGRCLMGVVLRNGCVEGYDVHHIHSRGSGGGDLEDNLICLCRKHHQDAHSGTITREQLVQALARFYPEMFQQTNK